MTWLSDNILLNDSIKLFYTVNTYSLNASSYSDEKYKLKTLKLTEF